MQENQLSLADQWAQYSQKLTPQQQFYLNSQALNGGQGNQFTPQQMQYLQYQQQSLQPAAQPVLLQSQLNPQAQYMQSAADTYKQFQEYQQNQHSHPRESNNISQPQKRVLVMKNGKKKKDRPHPYGNRGFQNPEARNEPIENTYMSGTHSCKPCGKEFTCQMMYQAHMQAHKKCPQCDFAALNKVLQRHVESEHGKKLEVVPQPQIEDPELKAWIEARKSRYPGTLNNSQPEKTPVVDQHKDEVQPAEHVPTSFKPCKFFLKGNCKKQNLCPFYHPGPSSKSVTVESALALAKAKSASVFQSLMESDKVSEENQLMIDAIRYICDHDLLRN